MHRLTYIRERASMNVSMQHCQNQDPPMNLFQKACSTMQSLVRQATLTFMWCLVYIRQKSSVR